MRIVISEPKYEYRCDFCKEVISDPDTRVQIIGYSYGEEEDSFEVCSTKCLLESMIIGAFRTNDGTNYHISMMGKSVKDLVP